MSESLLRYPSFLIGSLVAPILVKNFEPTFTASLSDDPQSIIQVQEDPETGEKNLICKTAPSEEGWYWF
jgi:hypothetical protein